ncbi:DUF7289 family protein [Halosimplex halobium]|uniref:DUF7289 family protein n=1 Tax=Halosimplex halobium TaxID=3396618 RepID=UPI003F5429E5
MRDNTSRGQSEVIGFVIVFSAILAATLVVGVFGLNALDSVQESTVANNGEIAMQAVGDDIESIYYGSAETSTTELTLDAATLEVGDPTRVEVSVVSTSTESWQWKLYPLVYRSDAASIYYENSLIVRQQRRGSVAVSGSLFRLDDERAVIPVVRTNATTNATVSGGTEQIRAMENGTEQVVRTNEDPSVTELDVTITMRDVPGRTEVWETALRDAYGGSGSLSCTNPEADEVACSFETETVVVSSVTVEYGFG